MIAHHPPPVWRARAAPAGGGPLFLHPPAGPRSRRSRLRPIRQRVFFWVPALHCHWRELVLEEGRCLFDRRRKLSQDSQSLLRLSCRLLYSRMMEMNLIRPRDPLPLSNGDRLHLNTERTGASSPRSPICRLGGHHSPSFVSDRQHQSRPLQMETNSTTK